MWYPVILTVLTGYFLGNLNGAVNVSALVAHDDVRSHGSGNAGLTNFIRNFGRGSAIFVLLIDGGKTALACLVGGQLLGDFTLEGMLLGAAAVSLGHDFPALLGFKGGKGIVCGAVAAFVIDWRVGLIGAAAFFLCYFLTHYVSLSSIFGAVGFGAGFALLYMGRPWMMAGGIFMAALAIFMHRENIVRLCKGTERKSHLFGMGKKP